jgi:flagellar hook-length control protein FliK
MIALSAIDEGSIVAPQKPARGANGEFSYALAAASLEKRAGAALQTHGATPEGVSFGEAPAQEAASRKSNPAPRAEAQAAQSRSAHDLAPAQRQIARLPVEAATTAQEIAPRPTPTALPTMPPVVLSAAAVSLLPPAARAAGPLADVSPLKIDAAREAASTRALRIAASAPPVNSPEDFADLIARRLASGDTEFNLRLDPPELGRIEAKLEVGDDGAARLEIRFENQIAFDLFARDEAALRLAFAQAGFDFGERGLSFAMARPEPAAQGADLSADATRPAPELLASIASARLIDVRI